LSNDTVRTDLTVADERQEFADVVHARPSKDRIHIDVYAGFQQQINSPSRFFPRSLAAHAVMMLGNAGVQAHRYTIERLGYIVDPTLCNVMPIGDDVRLQPSTLRVSSDFEKVASRERLSAGEYKSAGANLRGLIHEIEAFCCRQLLLPRDGGFLVAVGAAKIACLRAYPIY
jgi:hypothetical protein